MTTEAKLLHDIESLLLELLNEPDRTLEQRPERRSRVRALHQTLSTIPHPTAAEQTQTYGDGVRPPLEPGPMDAKKAAYFMERFKHEEKLLGPNEQKALDFVLAILEADPADLLFAAFGDGPSDDQCADLWRRYPSLRDWHKRTFAAAEQPHAIKVWASGGSTGVCDYLMSDGSSKAMTVDEAKATRQQPQAPEQGAGEVVYVDLAMLREVLAGNQRFVAMNTSPDKWATQPVTLGVTPHTPKLEPLNGMTKEAAKAWLENLQTTNTTYESKHEENL